LTLDVVYTVVTIYLDIIYLCYSLGNTCRNSTYALDPEKPNGYQIPFDER